MKQNVLVIGAGISGLVTAKTLLEYGYTVTVFEKDPEIGGVWASSRRYPGLTIQNTRDTYAFSDFRMPRDYPEFPSGAQMLDYLKAYAAHFGIDRVIRCNYMVERATLNTNETRPKWNLSGRAGDQPFEAEGDFLVVCNGTFSEPFIPSYPGMEAFAQKGGLILHTSTAGKPEYWAGKKVAVVGFGKSACDLASAIATETAHTYLVYRQAKWKVPKRIRGVNYKYIILTRFGEALTKLRYRNAAERLIHTLKIPRRLLRFMQNTFSAQQQLRTAGLEPELPVTDMLHGELSVESDGFYQNVLNHKITAVKGEISRFTPAGIDVPGVGEIAADTVIFGTGFTQTLPFFSKELLAELTDAEGNFLLYRNILPPTLPALAFVGYNSSFFCTLTSEIGALWLCEHLEGRIALPVPDAQIEQIREHLAWRKQFRQNALYKNASVYPFNLTYVDWLLKDMNARLPLPALLSEWLVVVNPGHYAGVKRKIMRRR